jgi:hypothetical protein
MNFKNLFIFFAIIFSAFAYSSSSEEFIARLMGMTSGTFSIVSTSNGDTAGSAIVTVNGIEHIFRNGELTPITDDSLLVEEGELAYTINPHMLNITKRPEGSAVKSTDGFVTVSTNGNAIIRGGSVTVCRKNSVRITCGNTETIYLELSSGERIFLLQHAKEAALKKSALGIYQGSWKTAEGEFEYHVSSLREVKPENRLQLLSLWDGENKLTLEQLKTLLVFFPGAEERVLALKTLYTRVEGFASLTKEDFLELAKIADPTSDKALELLASFDRLTREDKINFLESHREGKVAISVLNTISPADAKLEVRKQLFSNQRYSNAGERITCMKSLFSQDELTLSEVIGVFSRNTDLVEALSFFTGVSTLSGSEILALCQKLADRDKKDALQKLELSLKNLSSEQTCQIMRQIADFYKADSMSLLSKHTNMRKEDALLVFQGTADFYKAALIKAGLFKGFETNLENARKLVANISSSYKNDVFVALLGGV